MTTSLQRIAGAALAIMAAIAVWVAPAHAHRQHATLTSIDWNERARVIEVIHRFHAHDVIDGLITLGLIETPSMQSIRAQARFALYVEETFLLENAAGDALALDMVGVEMDGDYILVYQEAPLTAPPSVLSVQCGFFHDVFDDQTSYVNMRIAAETVTHIFEDGETIGRADFSTLE
ncbi:MAG: DUF6702 family protein [Pseudomonadota bacterium]